MSNNKLDQVLSILKKHNLRITNARVTVATILIENNQTYLSSDDIYQIIQKSDQYECDAASVYRTLTKFLEIELITKSSFKGEAARYQIETAPHSHKHEHYFKCIKCEKIEPFHGCLVVKKEKELQAKGYTSLEHHLEIIGLCPKCTKSAA